MRIDKLLIVIQMIQSVILGKNLLMPFSLVVQQLYLRKDGMPSV